MPENSFNNPVGFREALYESEKPYYDAFVAAMGRHPETLMELMQGSAMIQEKNKRERKFWDGVFGL